MTECDDVTTAMVLPTQKGSGVSLNTSSVANSCSSSVSAKTALVECSGAWINYLHVLNKLCSAGTKLAQSISALELCDQKLEKTNARQFCAEKNTLQNSPSTFLANSWKELGRATAVATATVKVHVLAILQDFRLLHTVENSQLNDVEQQRNKEHNHLIIIENAQTLINIQHQFCAASYDSFSSLTSCLVCQAPVGFTHETDCSMIKQKIHCEHSSQSSSPHSVASQRNEFSRFGALSEQRNIALGSTSSNMIGEYGNAGWEPTTSHSPQLSFRDASPFQGILENIRGPLPNPGRLLTMKVPFHRNAKAPLSFPLFPLNGQRRWSEAAAGEKCNEIVTDVESQMRRWSMPWEVSKTDQNTVTWYQTRMMPLKSVKLPNQKICSTDISTSNTPESPWQISTTSQDGLAEAIQLLSCRPIISNDSQICPLKILHPVDVSLLDERISF